MAGSLPFPASVSARAVDRTAARTAAIPWYVWCAVVAVTSAMVGAHWDISWHRSIGRDTFWTPAHIAIYMCGVLAGLSCSYLILSTTFDLASPLRAASVRIWGFHGPLGAFIAAWGGVAMITSAPFDNWWHNAYGLDVKILSPPHVLLITGIVGVQLGALILILGQMNRVADKTRAKLEWLFLYVGAMIIICLAVLVMEYTGRVFMHTGFFYRVVSLAIPGVLTGLARASGRRWAAGIVIGIYSLFLIGCVWILPLFPAEPKLGPVFYHVTHFVPPEFPLALIVPALALDWLWSRTPQWKPSLQAIVSGFVFVSVMLGAQWLFADFLMSPASRNWVFGTIYFDYNAHPNSFYVRNLFYPLERTGAQFWKEMMFALAAAIVTTRLGLSWGDWMRRIRR
ncbi:MAG TPA: hypothetical protein VLX58_09325 [Bryobacteraceae bacterium]|nr:hypothetical protein [Bryobacteraceae bacterium]